MLTRPTYWTLDLSVTLSMLWIAQSLKPELTVRRGPGSDPQCMSPLISSYEDFPDSGFSASSVLMNKTDFQPYQARLIEVYGSKEHTSGQAWCPNSLVGEILREWIEAEFSELVMIKSIFTAGRGDGNVKEFMPSFVLKYQREDGGAWYEHVKRDGTRVLKANSDPRNLARATLDSMIIAKRIRIYPFSRTGSQKVCLRFALYGCKFPDGVVSYSMPQGGWGARDSVFRPIIGNTLDNAIVSQLRDLSYDGQLVSTVDQLTDGLGQLMDNVAFLGNLTRESDLHPSQPGFHFVGWHPQDQTEVQILFKFDRIRQFTWLRLFTFDSIPLRVRLFSHAIITFSMDGVTFANAIEFSTGRVQLYDTRNSALTRSRRQPQQFVRPTTKHARHSAGATTTHADMQIFSLPDSDGAVVIDLPLGERIGRYVRLSLTPTDLWIVLTEVQFNCTVTQIPSTISPVTTPAVVESAELGGPPSAVGKSLERGSNSHNGDSIIGSAHSATSGGLPNVGNIGSRDAPVDGLSVDNQATLTKTAVRIRTGDDLRMENEKLVTALPIVVTIGVLLFLLPSVVLIWFCLRRHWKHTRMRCRGKLRLIHGARGAPHQPGSVDVFTHGSTAMTTDEVAKLMGSYSTVPFDPQTEAVPTSQFCLSNGTHSANLIHRLNEVGLVNSTGGMLSTMQLPARPTAVMGVTNGGSGGGGGGILPCSASSSCSSSDMPPTLPAVSTLSPSLPPGNFVPTTEVSNLYAGTEMSCMSPEYASASIFGYSPPPSETPSTAPPTCTESMPPTNYRPSLPTYAVCVTHPFHAMSPGATTIYTGPASVPLTSATLRAPPKHATPNPVHRFASGSAHPNAGVLLLSQGPFAGALVDDSSALCPSVTVKPTYGHIPDVGQSLGRYQTEPITAATPVSHPQRFLDGTATELLDPWLLSHAITPDVDPRQAPWMTEACNNDAMLTSRMLSHPVRMPIGPTGLVTLTQTNQPLQLLRPLVTQTVHQHVQPSVTDASLPACHHHSSPVGTAVGTTGYRIQSNTANANRDGTGSGRLSIYSLCT